MFEFDSAVTLRAEENERRPNRYAASALQIALLCQLFCLALNEINVFHVHKATMRLCTVVGAVCALIPLVIANSHRLSADRRSKYVVLLCTCGMCFASSLALFLFSAPMCALPMLLATQYNSRPMSRMAILGSCVCAAAAPPLGCALGLWDSEFLRFLASSAWGMEMLLVPAGSGAGTMPLVGPLGVGMFLSFPWMLIMLILGKLVMSVTQKGEESIDNRIQITRMSRLDALTGLFNQNVYNQYLKSPVEEDETVGVLFFDVDGLKRANDEHGHERGDILLRRCADSLRPLFDDHCHGFRTGGDEFVVVVDTDDPRVVDEKLARWRQEMDRVNVENRVRYKELHCHMSAGTAFGKKYDLPDLIIRADSRMYQEKEAYHKAQGIEMR